MADRPAHDQIWIDGSLVGVGQATVSPFDHGIIVGDGVFETLKVVDGTAFAMRRHLVRLRRSAAGLGLTITYDDDELRAAAQSVIEANHVGAGRLRLTVTGGVGPLGSDRGDRGPTVMAATADLAAWPPTAAVATVEWRRNERSAVAGLKTTSYAENVIALAYAHDHDATEAIFANTLDHLCEGTGTNVFVATDGRLATPPLSSGCLAGVTRELVIEALADRGVTVATDDLPLEALASADEAFLTSSTRDVQAIGSVDGVALLAPGPMTIAAAEAFAALAARDLDP
jgi:branched-chain amino acid aminotransferase